MQEPDACVLTETGDKQEQLKHSASMCYASQFWVVCMFNGKNI